MKRQTILMCLVFMMCSSVATAQNEPADSSRNASADKVSETFSKQFVLPDAYIMNTFSFEVYYTVYADKTVRVRDSKITSSVTKRTSGSVMHPDFSGTSAMNINVDLLRAVREWFTANGDVLQQTVEDFELVDSLPLVTQVYYSPILCAQSGDTLFCTGDLENEFLSNGEEAGTFYQFFIRNRRNTPYYALVRRNKNNVMLLIHDSGTGKLVNVVNYHIQSAELVTKSGNQMYVGEDGKSLRIKQVWDDNKLVSAETYNSEKKVEARYEFQYKTWYPKLKTKEVFYPSGSVMLRAEYDKDDVSITAFNEDGSKAKYLPAKNAEKTVNGYFKKHFNAPAISYKNTAINYFVLKLNIPCSIDESGAIRITTSSPTATWSYNYKKGLITSAQINRVIEAKYNPYFREFWQTLVDQALQCTPAKVNGKPVASTATIKIEHNFTPKFTSKPDPTPPVRVTAPAQSYVKPASSDTPPESREDVVFIVVEHMPEFPGGTEALIKFLQDNITYPQIAKENNIEGRVLCQFVVEKDGTITDIQVVRSGGDASLDKEAVRVLRLMPKWKPGKQQGKPVRVKYTVPVNFKL